MGCLEKTEFCLSTPKSLLVLNAASSSMKFALFDANVDTDAMTQATVRGNFPPRGDAALLERRPV